MSIWAKDQLITILHEEIVTISFNDYSLKCTLDPEYIPENFIVEDCYKKNPDMISVWDVNDKCIVTFNFRYIDSVEV